MEQIVKRTFEESCCIRTNIGDLVQRIEDEKIGTLLGMELGPNGRNSPELICTVKVKFPDGVTTICTSEKFRPVPNHLYSPEGKNLFSHFKNIHSMMKKAQVVMLPTEKSSHLYKSSEGFLYFLDVATLAIDVKGKNQQLYLTTDDEIKEGDWVITQAGHLRQCTHTRPQGDKYICLYSDNLVLTTHCRKIVATNNPDLLYNKHIDCNGQGCDECNKLVVAKIPIYFIEAYVREQGKIKEMMLEYEHQYQFDLGNGIMQNTDNVSGYGYDRLKLRSNGTVIIHPVKERKYTREEFRHAVRQAWIMSNGIVKFEEWFDQNYPE